MIEQITLKKANISDKSLHLSVQKTYSHKQGNNHSLDRSEVTGSGKKLFKQKGTGNARAGNKKTTQSLFVNLRKRESITYTFF